MFELIPDSLTGAVAAVEGIRNAAVLLNGPTGCKFYHGALSENQLPRTESIDPIYYSEEFYFGQPRVPATYLDDHDYVFGATEKLENILPVVAEKGHKLIAVINTPGAALIGDDLLKFIQQAKLAVPCIAIENTGFSGSPAEGFRLALAEVLRLAGTLELNRVQHNSPQVRKKVTLAGISLFHHHWPGHIRELKKMLAACGIDIHTVLCAGCTMEELASLGQADAMVVLHAEYAAGLQALLRKYCAQECAVSASGIPIGFDASEQWISAICAELGLSPEPAIDRIQRKRFLAYQALKRFNALTGLPKGVTFGIQGDGSIAYPLTKWLYQYLGMVPAAIRLIDAAPADRQCLQGFLQSINGLDVLEKDIQQTMPEIIFGSGALLSRLRPANTDFVGIEISLPVSGYQHVQPKSFIGPDGALYLIERIINGLAGYAV